MEEVEADRLGPGEYSNIHQIYYDYWGATTPEEAELPISYWSKERIVEYARRSEKIRPEIIPVIENIKLADLKGLALRKTGRRPTGNLRDMRPKERGEWRNTDYFGLDVESLNSLI